MGRCSVRPYEGDKNYIFVSYCHKDKDLVFPIIEQLAKDGYRIWYDEGIDPGSEWPEIIAQHLNDCRVCLAFITENSSNSHNCRREVTFALQKKKSFISIILEEVKLSLGMEMQLSATQAIYKYKLSGDDEFFMKIYGTDFLRECRGEFEVPDEPVEESPKTKSSFILLRLKTNERIALREGEFKLGRSDTMCDYVIRGNSIVGRFHARIVNNGTECLLIDNNSLNGTFVNGIRLEPEQGTILKNEDKVQLANEIFTFYCIG